MIHTNPKYLFVFFGSLTAGGALLTYSQRLVGLKMSLQTYIYANGCWHISAPTGWFVCVCMCLLVCTSGKGPKGIDYEQVTIVPRIFGGGSSTQSLVQ